MPVISMTKFNQDFVFSGKNLKSHTDILTGIIISVCADIKHYLLEQILTFQLNSLSIKFQTFCGFINEPYSRSRTLVTTY